MPENLTPIIAVPARNEEERLPLLFTALAMQDWQLGRGRTLPVVIVLNNCTDGSRSAVLHAQATYPSLEIKLIDITYEGDDAHVGNARRLAMDTALACCDDAANSVIITTDADAVPRHDWVSANLRHIADGVDLVGGLIYCEQTGAEVSGPEIQKLTQNYHLYNETVDRLNALVNPLPHDPWPRHTDEGGASIAVRADVYRAVGGMPALPVREDSAFLENVRRAGYLVRHPMDVVIDVSGRLEGRAPGGMADSLRSWYETLKRGEPLLVEHPGKVWQRLHNHPALPADHPETMLADDAIIVLKEMIDAAAYKTDF